MSEKVLSDEQVLKHHLDPENIFIDVDEVKKHQIKPKK